MSSKSLTFALFGNLYQQEKSAAIQQVLACLKVHGARVVIDEEYRHMGLGTALVSHIESLPELSGLRGILLTKDAHGLYEKFGYRSSDGRAMVKAP